MPEPSHLGGVNLPGLLSVMLILIVAFAPVLFGRRGPASEQDDGESDDGGGPGGPKPPSRPPGPSPGGIPLDDRRSRHARNLQLGCCSLRHVLSFGQEKITSSLS